MKRPRVDEEEVECGPGDCDLDLDSLLVKTERRELASFVALNERRDRVEGAPSNSVEV
jgi:hypothetical protein